MTIGRTTPRNGIRAAPVGAPQIVATAIEELWPDVGLDDPSKFVLLGTPSTGSSTLANGLWTVTAWNGGGFGNFPKLQLSSAESTVLNSKLTQGASYTITVTTTAPTNGGTGGISAYLAATNSAVVPNGSAAGTYSFTFVAGNPTGDIGLLMGRSPGDTQVTSISLKRTA